MCFYDIGIIYIYISYNCSDWLINQLIGWLVGSCPFVLFPTNSRLLICFCFRSWKSNLAGLGVLSSGSSECSESHGALTRSTLAACYGGV